MLNSQRYQSIFFTLVLSLIISGCSLLPQKDEQQAALAKLNNWQISGKISVRHPKDNVTGYLTWKQNQTAFDLYIAGPLAQGATQIKGDKNKVSLLLPGWKEPQTDTSANNLMQKHLGWSFPIDDLRFWIKGMVNPNSSAKQIKYADNGLLKSLNKHGWFIELSRYQYQGGYWLPARIKITGKQYRFVMAIKNWSIYD